MSRNYSASQYEKTFTPKRLQMYEVPKESQPGIVSSPKYNYRRNDLIERKCSSIQKHRWH